MRLPPTHPAWDAPRFSLNLKFWQNEKDFDQPRPSIRLIKPQALNWHVFVMIFLFSLPLNNWINIQMKFVDNFCRDLHTNISIQFGDTLVRGWFGKISKDINLQWSEMEWWNYILVCCPVADNVDFLLFPRYLTALLQQQADISHHNLRILLRRRRIEHLQSTLRFITWSFPFLKRAAEMRGKDKQTYLEIGARSTARVINSCTTFPAANSFNASRWSKQYFL